MYAFVRNPDLRGKVAWPRGRRYTRRTMRTRSTLPVGKLPPAVLQGLLRACHPPASSGVVIGPRYGEDAAVIDLGAKYLVAKTDPITFTEERIGWYAVHINANDIATLGARPRWFLATVLLPEGRTTRGAGAADFPGYPPHLPGARHCPVRRPHGNHLPDCGVPSSWARCWGRRKNRS